MGPQEGGPDVAPPDVSSMVSGRFGCDSRNNWLVFMFVSKTRKIVFRKQSTINAFLSALQEAREWGYGFREVGFGGSHVHFEVDVPSKLSKEEKELLAKLKELEKESPRRRLGVDG